MPKKRWQRIIWSLQTGDRLFSLADRQPWNWGRSVIWWRRRTRWGHSSLRRPGRGFISLEITKKRSLAPLWNVSTEIGEMFPDIFIKCQLFHYCFPLFEMLMTLHCLFIVHISGSIFHPNHFPFLFSGDLNSS